MKLKALFRIIWWAVLSILLTSFLFFGLSGELENLKRSVGLSDYDDTGYLVYDDPTYWTDAGTENSKDNYAALPAEQIRSLQVEWIKGSVTIQNNERSDREVRIWETSRGKLEKADHLRYRIKDGVLSIKFAAPRSSALTAHQLASKQLRIELPSSLRVSMQTVEIDCVSSSVKVLGVQADDMQIQSVSGKVTLSNSIGKKTKVQTTSGTVLLNYSQFFDFRMRYDTTLGELNTNLAFKERDGWQYYKEGSRSVEIVTMGGNLEIT